MGNAASMLRVCLLAVSRSFGSVASLLCLVSIRTFSTSSSRSSSRCRTSDSPSSVVTRRTSARSAVSSLAASCSLVSAGAIGVAPVPARDWPSANSLKGRIGPHVALWR